MSNHKQVIAEINEDLQRWAITALDAAQMLAINYMRGDGKTTQPGARVRQSRNGRSYYWYSPALPRRQAHPGLWADVTGLTANSYSFEEPRADGNRIKGALFNTAPHAEDLEGKRRAEGGRYWVLAGLDSDSGFRSDFDIARVFQQQFNALVDDN